MSGEHTRLGHTMTATFRMTDSPKWLSHFEITRDGDKITILVVKRNEIIQCEADADAKQFFDMIDKLKEF